MALFSVGCSTTQNIAVTAQNDYKVLNALYEQAPSARVKISLSAGYITFFDHDRKGKSKGLVVNNKTGDSYFKEFNHSILPTSTDKTSLETVIVFHTTVAFEDFLSGKKGSKSLDENAESTRYLTIANSGINFADVTVYNTKAELSAGL